jgi:small basic protein (TIGR04137 family)
MSMDKSLKSKGELVRHRNVLTRAERVAALADQERWDDSRNVFGLPKVANRKVQTRKKAPAVAKAAGVAAAEGAAAPAAPAPAAAGPAKAAAPARKEKSR